MGMFIMSLGEFSDIYEQFDCSNHPILGKVSFLRADRYHSRILFTNFNILKFFLKLE